MVDILKITSAIPSTNRVDHTPKQLPGDAVFDVNRQEHVTKYTILPRDREADSKGTLMQNLNREIFEAVKADLSSQTDNFKKLVLFMKFFENPALSGTKESALDIFMRPQDMLSALFERDKGNSIFQGELFDALRVLAKADQYPKVQDAIVNVLKYFDCFVNKDNSLNAIFEQAKNFASMLRPDDANQVMNLLDRMQNLMNSGASQKDMASFIKNDLLPLLSNMVDKYGGSEKLQSQIMSIIHNVMRYDKADGALLDDAMARLGAELKTFGKLTDDDISDMRRMLFDHARDAKEMANKGELSKLAQGAAGDKEMLDIIAKALESNASSKLNMAAQNMLVNLIQNESPVMALLHFLLPIKYGDEDTYAEVYVDKDADERKGGADSAQNIFFIIQSEKFGNFEVDLLAKDKTIDLDIRCPNTLLDDVKALRGSLNDMISEQGFRLAAYKVDQYDEDRTILQRFPKLAMRKAGIDVRI